MRKERDNRDRPPSIAPKNSSGCDQPPEIIAHAECDLFVVEACEADDHRDGAAISGEQYAIVLCLSHT